MPTRRIVDAWMETHNVRTIRFDFRDDPIDFKAGQFIVCKDEFRGYKRPVQRAYSIASTPWQRDFVDITIKRELPGLMSARLTEVPVGYEMEVTGPSGKYLYDVDRGKRVLLLGAGSGITPLYSIANYLLEGGIEGADVMMYYSVRSPADIIYEAHWPKMVSDFPNFKFHLTVTRAKPNEWSGRHGRISTDWVRQTAGDVSDAVSYICGPSAMVGAMEDICRELGLPEERINTEKW
jgi:ferredoxin-NADP reductase